MDQKTAFWKRWLVRPMWRYAIRLTQGRAPIFLCGVGVTLLVCFLEVLSPVGMEFQDMRIYDAFLRRERTIKRSGVPVIVDIDETSLARFGQWPWPRFRMALLLGILREAGVKAVGLDMVFAEPDRTSPTTLIEQFEKELRIQVDFSGLPGQLRNFDRLFGEVLGSGPFVLGYFLQYEKVRGGDEAVAIGEDCPLPEYVFNSHVRPGGQSPERFLLEAAGASCPLPLFLKSGAGAGFFNATPDSDNILRRSPMLLSYKGTIEPSLSLATVMRAYGVKNALIQSNEDGLEALVLSSPELGRTIIPLDKAGRILINYRAARNPFPVVSAADILDGRFQTADLAGKIVYLGTSAPGLKDLRASPLYPYMPGMEVHATITDMILTGDYLLRPPSAFFTETMSTLALGIIAAALLAWTRAVFLLVPFGLLGAGVWFGSAELFALRKIYISPLYPLLTLGLNFALLTFLKFWREESQKRFIHAAFSHYLSPKVVAQIVDSPNKLTLTGEEREVSIIFTDVRGFTSISEKLSPAQVVNLLHRYLTPMTRIITDNMGTMDKFIGDAIMAFWNAPLDVPEHPKLAVKTALAMLKELSRLNVGFRENYGFEIKIGVGLHCGPARVGNFGSEDLFDYTIIGDSVNLCSRLESLTKFYGLPLLVSDALAAAAPGPYLFLEVDRVRVKGKTEPVTLYTVLSEEDSRERVAELELYGQALARYKAGDFAGARGLFAQCRAANDHPLYALYAERCAALAADPPTGSWDGVFTHVSK